MQNEEEQIQAIKYWWRENGLAVMLGVIVGFGSLFGWQGWQNHLNKLAEQASSIYSELMVAMESEQGKGVAESADELAADFSSTPYAALAAFAAAKVAIMIENDSDAAKERYQWVIDNGKQKEFVYLAKLRLVRILIQVGDIAAAERLLIGDDYPESFVGRLAELRGDLYAGKGDFLAARAAYDAAIMNELPVQNRQMVEIKRDNVAEKVSLMNQLPDIEVDVADQVEPSDA